MTQASNGSNTGGDVVMEGGRELFGAPEPVAIRRQKEDHDKERTT